MLGSAENGSLLRRRAGRSPVVFIGVAVALGCAALAAVVLHSGRNPSVLLGVPHGAKNLVSVLAQQVGKLDNAQELLQEEQQVDSIKQNLKQIESKQTPFSELAYDTRVALMKERLRAAKQRLANSLWGLAAKGVKGEVHLARPYLLNSRQAQQQKSTNQLGFISGRETHNYLNDGATYYRCATHGKWGLEPCVNEYANETYFPLVPGVWDGNLDLGSHNIEDYAWSSEDDPVIGDTGSMRYRPTYYGAWDGSGREITHADTMTEESFGAPFAAPRRKTGLAAAAAPKLTKLDIPDDFDPVAGAVGFPIETAQHANGQQNYGPGASRPDDENIPAYDFWYAKGRRGASAQQKLATAAAKGSSAAADKQVAALTRQLQSLEKELADKKSAAAAGSSGSSGSSGSARVEAAAAAGAAAAAPLAQLLEKGIARARLSLAREDRSADALRAQAAEVARLEAAIGSAQRRLDTALRTRRAAARVEAALGAHAAPVARQALSLRQDREGDYATESLGRYHGCAPSPITGVPADDCEPLPPKMEAGAAATAAILAQRRVGYAGVHWTSGDVDPREDVFPSRELAGGYSGIADIEFPADKVRPTLYRPIFNGHMDPSPVSTKAAAAAAAAAAGPPAIYGRRRG